MKHPATGLVPVFPALTLDYQGTPVAVADFSASVEAALLAQKTEAEKQRDVTNAKTSLRAADRKCDRGNKRWYQAWLLAYPVGTPEGDAAISQIPTEQGTAQAQVLAILATPLTDHRVRLTFGGGAHATTKELQHQLPGEPEFGYSTPITANDMTVGPFTAGLSISFRTRVANSNPGFVTSPAVTVIELVIAPPTVADASRPAETLADRLPNVVTSASPSPPYP